MDCTVVLMGPHKKRVLVVKAQADMIGFPHTVFHMPASAAKKS